MEEWILVRSDILPDVLRRVLAVEADLSSGQATSVSQAVRLHGISRSAYYKYRGCVAPYVGKAAAPTMAGARLLQDAPGVLSAVLSAFAKAGADILTVNQDSPDGGTAHVSVCARTEAMSTPIDLFISGLEQIPGVRHLRLTRS